jgi:hypothetical protein
MSVTGAANSDTLCYLSARDVEIPAGTLAGMELCSLDGENLGTLDGVLIDPALRRLRYLVIASGGWLGRARYVLSADEPVHFELRENIMRLDAKAGAIARHAFDPALARPFSDDDLLAALFSTHAA